MRYTFTRAVETGLGDKLIDLCGCVTYCKYLTAKTGIPCDAVIVTCDEICKWGAYRSSDFDLASGVFVTKPPEDTVDVLTFPVHAAPGCSLHPLKLSRILNVEATVLKQDILSIARTIRPGERVNACLPDLAGAIGIHLRKSDKVSNDESVHHGTRLSEYADIISKLKTFIKLELIAGRRKFYVCSEDHTWKRDFEDYIQSRCPSVDLLQPDFSKSSDVSDNLHAVTDFFALSKCDRILQGIGYSTFSMMASMLRNVTIVNFSDRARRKPAHYLNWWKPLLMMSSDHGSGNFVDESIWLQVDKHVPDPVIDFRGIIVLNDPECLTSEIDQPQPQHRNKADKVLVVARYREDISWIRDTPDDYDVVIYNKGPANLVIPETVQHRSTLIRTSNVGREAGTYLQFIIDNYNDMYAIVVMCQGDPFPHAPEFLTALRNFQHVQSYLPLTLWYLPDVKLQHSTMAQLHKKNRFYRNERISVHTLAPIYFYDNGVSTLCNDYLKYYHLPLGSNIMAHHLSEAGMPTLLPKEAELINFTYSAIFMVSSRAILQHPLEVYRNLLHKTCRPGWFEASIMERTWQLLFDTVSSLRVPVDRPELPSDIKKSCRVSVV